MTTRNKYGLSRNIPTRVKKEVRRRSKNGCVVCRCLLYEYQHFSPRFSEARKHDPNGICLLCPNCHTEMDRKGALDEDSVRRAYLRIDSNPDVLPPYYKLKVTGNITLILGDASFHSNNNRMDILRYDGESIFYVAFVDDVVFGGFRPSLNGRLFDCRGECIVEIDDNEISFLAQNIDILFAGSTIKISRRREKLFELKLLGLSSFSVSGLVMRYKEVVLDWDSGFRVAANNIRGGSSKIGYDRIDYYGADCIVDMNSNRLSWQMEPTMAIGGGDRPTKIPGTGCSVLVGGDTAGIPMFALWISKFPVEAHYASWK